MLADLTALAIRNHIVRFLNWLLRLALCCRRLRHRLRLFLCILLRDGYRIWLFELFLGLRLRKAFRLGCQHALRFHWIRRQWHVTHQRYAHRTATPACAPVRTAATPRNDCIQENCQREGDMHSCRPRQVAPPAFVLKEDFTAFHWYPAAA